jgi:hypothetical protein
MNKASQYTKQLPPHKRFVRNACDVGHNVFVVGLGNVGLYVVNLVKQGFDPDADMKRFKPLHRQRMDRRENELGMKRHYKDQRELLDMEAAMADRALAEQRKSPERKTFDAMVRLFDLMSDTQAHGTHDNTPYTLSAFEMNQCVIRGVQQVRDQGMEISPEELDLLSTNGQPGIYPEHARARNLAVAKLPGRPGSPLREHCKAAIAQQFLDNNLVPEVLIREADFPRAAPAFTDESSSRQSIQG